VAKEKSSSYNDSMGQSRKSNAEMEHEVTESEDYQHNKDVMRGHQQDSRFDEGSTHGLREAKIVRPTTTPKTSKAKYDPPRKWNLGSDHKI
jgi:hypothetical protein